MKKIIVIMFSILLFLGGCSNPANITEDDLVAAGYTNDGSGKYVYSDETSIVYVDDDGVGAFDSIGIEVYLNQVDPYNQDRIQLSYEFFNNNWYAETFYGNTHTILNPNDAYAYINAVAPVAIAEFNKLIETANISTDILEGGDKTVVEDEINYNLFFSNVQISNSTYTNPTMEANFVDEEYFLQVNFDITNNGIKSLNLEDLDFNLVYDNANIVSINLKPIAPDDTDLTNKVLNPGDTMSIQMTTIVPEEATNFYVEVNSQIINIYQSSDYVDKTN